ncbi:DNA repair protein rad8 [Cladorrhinum sp. PSN259]|nr:DNA repair protein rad8 [Cladorrhinum sp. PSN259]
MPVKRRTIKSYIAAGCLALDLPSIRDTITWPPVDPDRWLQFQGPFRLLKPGSAESSNDSDTDGCPPKQGLLDLEGIQYHSFAKHALEFLPSEIQRLLLSSAYLSPFRGLFEEQWIHLSFGLHPLQTNVGIVRVYILPDDVDNRRIPRSNPSLRKARQKLLSQLDFGWTAYMGVPNGVNAVDRMPSPIPWEQRAAPSNSNSSSSERQSLLEMFNNIPSPNPTPDSVDDLDAREAMESIFSSTIPGVNTVLYAYQRRSAALMLQRESQIQQVLDPRLAKVIDQLGKPWYYDAVAGTSLREPRHYDRPCGGILAEEMGSGKTLICLALILATKHIPSTTPEIYRDHKQVIRPRVASLADMAAACINRSSVPWKRIFTSNEPDGFDFAGPIAAIQRNANTYLIPQHSQRRVARANFPRLPPRKVRLSHTSLVIVPPNLVQQWRQEISKHTSGLKVLVIDKNSVLPPTDQLLEYDMLLFSSARFERLPLEAEQNHLAGIHFKRCIIDEGHKLGNSTLSKQSNLHLVVNMLQISAKWIVTGTPSKGLFGVDDKPSSAKNTNSKISQTSKRLESSGDLENDDLKRIGSIATYYLHMRPWANVVSEAGDTPADWSEYAIKSKQSRLSARRRASSIRITLDALIIRHRLSELGNLLPPVDEKFVYLDGSYQDVLAQNLFSMVIIFNAVQSERTDQDYLFHPRQRKALVELVSNVRQAGFFGGSFFSPAQISKSVETAEEFLQKGKIKISIQDEALLRSGIEVGKLALRNSVKTNANLFRDIPIYIQNFPWKGGKAWSWDQQEGDPVCTSSNIVTALQKLVQPVVDAPVSLQMMYDSGRFAARGQEQRLKVLEEQVASNTPSASTKTLAGNTQLGEDSNGSKRRRSAILGKGQTVQVVTTEGAEPTRPSTPIEAEDITIAPALAETQLISTASAKLSYLVDQIVKYQDKEQIIIFYENDNVAYYIAEVLEILQIQHLIYARGLTPERRSQYVATFNNTSKFRVLLMDITQAAFGLDMKAASRIYFINPVLNPQVEAQAIGRARRISQQKPVTVETLVLKGSVEEVIVKRRGEMTQAEQWKCRSILDDKPIYEWILNASILPLPKVNEEKGEEQMAKLARPQFIFGRDFGRRELGYHEGDLVNVGAVSPSVARIVDVREALAKERKEPGDDGTGGQGQNIAKRNGGGPSSPSKKRDSTGSSLSSPKKKKPKVQFADSDDEEEEDVPHRAVVKLGTPTPV